MILHDQQRLAEWENTGLHLSDRQRFDSLQKTLKALLQKPHMQQISQLLEQLDAMKAVQHQVSTLLDEIKGLKDELKVLKDNLAGIDLADFDIVENVRTLVPHGNVLVV